MKEETATVVENRQIQNDYYLLKLNTRHVSKNGKPGNFIMIGVSTTLDPLLKRPLGIFDISPPDIWIYYKIAGRGTRLISKLHPGDQIPVLGPLGNTFPELTKQSVLAIAGGRGIAPIHFALKEYLKKNRVFLLYGARSKHDLNLLEKLDTLPLSDMILYSDDGSIGEKGPVTRDLKEIIKKQGINVTISCGPDEMLKEIQRATMDLNTKNYGSFEAFMCCGFGICHSCIIKNNKGKYFQVCSDGPVFNMDEILW